MSGLKDMVYNDFFIGEDSDVPGLPPGHRAGDHIGVTALAV